MSASEVSMPVVMTAIKSPSSASCSMYMHACMQFSGQLTAQAFPHKSPMPGKVAFGFKVQRVTVENYKGKTCSRCRQIDCEQIRSTINPQLIARHFGYEGLHQLCAKQYVCS